MNWLQVLMLIPMIVRLISFVEKIISGAKQGSIKKEMVLSAIEIMLRVMVSAGMLKTEDIPEIMKVISDLVDELVTILNGMGVFRHGG